MECLRGYIGIRWKGAETPDSGLYINQLPGVSLKSIDNLANPEQIDFLGVWEDVETRSLKRLQTAITNYFGRKYQLVQINESLGLPTYHNSDAGFVTPPGANYRGFTFDLGWYGSDLARIHVEQLRLWLDAPEANLEIKFFEVVDGETANEIDSITIDGVAGWNVVKVQEDYDVFKLFVGYDATNITSVFMPVSGLLNGGQWFYWNWGNPISPYQGILRGAQSDKPYGGLSEGSNLYGLSGNISTVCSFDGIICNNKSTFTNVLWYTLGYELMTERIYSDRLNRYTTIALKRAETLRDEFAKQLAYEMEATFDGIELTTWDGCLVCNAPVRLEHSLP